MRISEAPLPLTQSVSNATLVNRDLRDLQNWLDKQEIQKIELIETETKPEKQLKILADLEL